MFFKRGERHDQILISRRTGKWVWKERRWSSRSCSCSPAKAVVESDEDREGWAIFTKRHSRDLDLGWGRLEDTFWGSHFDYLDGWGCPWLKERHRKKSQTETVLKVPADIPTSCPCLLRDHHITYMH